MTKLVKEMKRRTEEDFKVFSIVKGQHHMMTKIVRSFLSAKDDKRQTHMFVTNFAQPSENKHHLTIELHHQLMTNPQYQRSSFTRELLLTVNTSIRKSLYNSPSRINSEAI